jgi:hypothetical protein
VVAAIIVIAVFVVPPSWSYWAVGFGLVGLVIGNLALASVGGHLFSLGRFLDRARRFRRLDSLIATKERTREILSRYLVIVAIVGALLAPFPARAAGTCGIIIDPTISVSPAARQIASNFVERTIFDYIDAMACSELVIVVLGNEPRFATRTWLEALRDPAKVDCRNAPAVALAGEAALFGWSHNVAEATKQEGIDECQQVRALAAHEFSSRRNNFLKTLREALEVHPTVSYSPVTATIVRFSGSGELAHVLVLSDLLDTPPVSLEQVQVPDGVSVVLIALSPDPKYGSVKDVTARMRLWEGKANVTVLTVNELGRPGLWSELASKR